MAERVVEVVRRIAAPPDVVFAFLTDPEKYTRWKGVAAELDPRPGGVYRVQMSADAFVRGQFVEVEAPSRVVFTWGWEGNDAIPPGSTTVEVVLEPDGDETIATLRHSGFPDDGAADEHGQGWEHYLSRLAPAAQGGDPGPDPLLSGA